MQAVRLHAFGEGYHFRVEDVPDPVPGPGEALVRVAASSLNVVDVYLALGALAQVFPLDLPAILGCDAAGTAVALGPGVAGFAPGDRVLARVPVNGRGAYAELAAVPVEGVARLPDAVGFEAGATLPLAALTARQAVDALGGVGPGDRVLVAGALGAVGRAAVQYLRELGATPVAGVRAERLGEGRELAGEALDIGAPPLSPGFDLAVGAASGPAAVATVAHVRDGGTLASPAVVPGDANPGDRIRIVSVMSGLDAAMLGRIAEAAARGDLALPVAATFPLAEHAAAHRMLAGGARGKVVLLHP